MDETDVDRYGRMVAIVIIRETNVNDALLKAGLAWHYSKYDNNPAWAKFADDACRAKVGLWFRPNATTPWEFTLAGRYK